ncbi:unnamed protein product [Brassicogethes aeneus]|uniref:Uncharacterized protein n=1 Tax=Brassicogethes aeneus TaxID=1431903 RepID=A0A9P0B194_BRAAE|nr:unnamed protein product [Brassicogethes aeneus]
MLLQATPGECGSKPASCALEPRNSHVPDFDGTHTHMLDYAPAPGWTVHVTKEGRLYYCKYKEKLSSARALTRMYGISVGILCIEEEEQATVKLSFKEA